METTPASRAPVHAGTTYTLWFLARGDVSWAAPTATVSLVWYVNATDSVTVGEATNLDLTLPARLSTTDPMLTFHLSATAPGGAQFAGVRLTRPPNDYAAVILDDFVIMAEPLQVVLSIAASGQNANLSWPRSLSFVLQASGDLATSNNWTNVNSAAKGFGVTDYLNLSLTGGALFFRLTAPGQP